MKRTIRTTIIGAVSILLAFATAASAQDTTSTHLEVSDPGNVDAWEGDAVSRSIDVRLCWEAGGENPEDGDVTIDVHSSAPDWVTVSHSDEITLGLPQESEESDCTEPVTLTVELSASEGPREGERFVVEIHLEPRTEENTTGTFATPNSESAAITVTTMAPTVDDTATEADAAATESEEEDDEERRNWWPFLLALLLIAVVVLVGAVLLGRRRP